MRTSTYSYIPGVSKHNSWLVEAASVMRMLLKRLGQYPGIKLDHFAATIVGAVYRLP